MKKFVVTKEDELRKRARERYRQRMANPEYRQRIREIRQVDRSALTEDELKELRAKELERVHRYRSRIRSKRPSAKSSGDQNGSEIAKEALRKLDAKKSREKTS